MSMRAAKNLTQLLRTQKSRLQAGFVKTVTTRLNLVSACFT